MHACIIISKKEQDSYSTCSVHVLAYFKTFIPFSVYILFLNSYKKLSLSIMHKYLHDMTTRPSWKMTTAYSLSIIEEMEVESA